MKITKLILQTVFLIFLCGNIYLKSIEEQSERMQPSFLLKVLEKLEQGQNIIFTKYGDGEYFCMIGMQGHNCDYDSYHPWLGQALKKALVSLSKKTNTYIGKWWNAEAWEFCDNLAQQNSTTVPWVWYHLFMNDDNFFKYDFMYRFVNFVVTTQRKKILLCNSMNRRLKDFFRVDTYIEIPAQNWSYDYNKWHDILEKHVERDALILICGGMCSKVLIDDITNKYDVTFIDLGCSFDILSGKRNSRGWRHSYYDELRYYKDFIPANWD